MSEADVDLLIIGGGINGAGIAREAARRGFSVMLVEKDDLAAHTSSASSKLIHGGLRYLEQFEFRLVRESLTERERLLAMAPHIVEPLQFVLPLTNASLPGWMVRGGLFLYDHLGGRGGLPASRPVELDEDSFGAGLKPIASTAFSYWDCKVQDSRLVILNAMDAAEHGAEILPRTELIDARRDGDGWITNLRDKAGEWTVRARALVNAAGPWAGELFDRLSSPGHRPGVRLVKGSHIVLPRLYPGEHAFILPGEDGRVVFAIPYEGEFTLVGTTDVECREPVERPTIGDDEVDYLLAVVGRTFTSAMSRSDIAWSYSGIRALSDDANSNPSQVTRDYRLDLDAADDAAPLLSVIGGKITTYRRLAERAMDELAALFPNRPRARAMMEVLPGGDIPSLEEATRDFVALYPGLPDDLIHRLVRTYGSRTAALLGSARSVDDLGEHFGASLYAREVDYLVSQEWALTAEDILFRRTKLGLHLPAGSSDRLDAYLTSAGERGRS